MELKVNPGYKKFAPLYILQILNKYTDENHKLTYERIVKILENDGFEIDRKTIYRCLEDLKSIGVDIQGVGERDADDKKKYSRSGVWLKRDFSNENLQMLIDSVLYSKYIPKDEAKTLIGKIRELGNEDFRNKNKGIAKLDFVYHKRDTAFFRELNVIQQAIALGRKLTITNIKRVVKNGEIKKEEKNIIISPYHLVFANGFYYLIGYNEEKQEIWHLRVDRIYNAKIEDSPVKPISDTELKGVDIGDYLLSNPKMFPGKKERVIIKIDSDQIEHVYDTFGEKFSVYGSDELTTTIRIDCNLKDAYYWALQYSGIVEVLEPQELRKRLRDAAEELVSRYMSSDGDRYDEALRKSENNGDLDLTGIKLGNRTKHYAIRVKTLKLSDNNIQDISFIRNYEQLNMVELNNNPIRDLSPLTYCKVLHTVRIKNLQIDNLSALVDMPYLQSLSLEGCENVDCSAVYQMKNLKWLTIWGSVKNLDLDELKKYNPKLKVDVRKVRDNTDEVKSINSDYPLNVLCEAFGYNHVLVGDRQEAIKAVDNMLLRLPKDEYDVAKFIYKENLSADEISKRLTISVDEIIRRKHECERKFKLEDYKKGLEKFIEVKYPLSTNALEKLWDMAEIPEEDRPAYKKTD